jgi:hypothetical protein
LTRLSLAPLALLLPAFAACAAGERRPLRAALPAAAGALALPAAVFLGFLALCGDRFVFGIFGFHHAVASRFEIIPQLLEFARTAFVENTGLWTLVVVAGVVALGTGVVVGEMQPRIRPRAFEWLVALAWLSCTAIHAAARPAQRVYQMTLAWAPCLLGAWLWAAVAARFPRWRVALAGAYVVAAVAWMPWQDGWLHFRQPRTPAAVYEAASVLREGAPGDTLLTFDSGVAFCSPKTALLPGYEMSEFSMVLSSTPDIEAHMRGVSVAQFMDDLRTRARWIALRDLDIGRLAGATGDAIIGALGMYVPVKRVEHYGQLDEELIIARRRP